MGLTLPAELRLCLRACSLLSRPRPAARGGCSPSLPTCASSSAESLSPASGGGLSTGRRRFSRAFSAANWGFPVSADGGRAGLPAAHIGCAASAPWSFSAAGCCTCTCCTCCCRVCAAWWAPQLAALRSVNSGDRPAAPAARCDWLGNPSLCRMLALATWARPSCRAAVRGPAGAELRAGRRPRARTGKGASICCCCWPGACWEERLAALASAPYATGAAGCSTAGWCCRSEPAVEGRDLGTAAQTGAWRHYARPVQESHPGKAVRTTKAHGKVLQCQRNDDNVSDSHLCVASLHGSCGSERARPGRCKLEL